MFINVELEATGERINYNCNEIFSVREVKITNQDGELVARAEIHFKNGQEVLVHHQVSTVCNACQTALGVGVVQVS